MPGECKDCDVLSGLKNGEVGERMLGVKQADDEPISLKTVSITGGDLRRLIPPMSSALSDLKMLSSLGEDEERVMSSGEAGEMPKLGDCRLDVALDMLSGSATESLRLVPLAPP